METGPIDEFWKWFEGSHHQLGNASLNHQIRNELLERLHRIDGGLYYELSVDKLPFELVLTCEGRRRLFGLVRSVVEAAPDVDGWMFFALKQPKGFDFITRYRDVELNPKDMWFLPLIHNKEPESLGLRVGIRPFEEVDRDKCANAVLIVLDTALGEQTAAEEVAYVEVVPLPDNPESEGYIELPDLPRYLEWRKNRSAGKS